MSRLRIIHLYLGCTFAPALIFFAVSGILQMFDLHEARKDGSYTPAKTVKVMSEIHRHQRPAGEKGGELPLRIFVVGASLGLVATTVLGIVMAFRLARKPWAVVACIGLGIVLPVGMLLLQ